MPRLPPTLVGKARKRSPLLPLILQVTRSLPSAINELRWLREHVAKANHQPCNQESRRKLVRLVKRRARGEPLQYILGTQPFGNLEIICKHGVLIPRPETEAYTLHLAKLIRTNQLHTSITKIYSHPKRQLKSGGKQQHANFRILDVCSGSGAISLLLRSALRKMEIATSDFFILGLDSSEKAVTLARRNREWNEKLGHLPRNSSREIRFQQRDIFEPLADNEQMWDIIVSNPPYVSHESFERQTKRSVRNFEPHSALMPHVPKRIFGLTIKPEDIFYKRLVEIYYQTYSKVLLMEVGDAAQAIRVIQLFNRYTEKSKLCRANPSRVEIWRDFPNEDPEPGKISKVVIEGETISIKGVGKIRSVIFVKSGHGTPQTKKDFKIKHLILPKTASQSLAKPRKRIYGPPELKATWKILNSPMGTEGRVTRGMARGWKIQKPEKSTLADVYAPKYFGEADIKNIKKHRAAEYRDMGLAARAKRAFMKKGISDTDSEPFWFR
ncbi:BgTH12-02238 [Blumeria graminis f. sp. triticale]|uniref:Bgt-4293 n=3 Tax=Blumeria graminis TaxID=34373 RepID=A0A061HJY5_BLUGR|nr:S-adenosylmethionine-dependent methyltransferase [Blumeria graminis f. sp. tritici 96224]CAD6501995.1 BgTH12-02238 [Blumeria graminis f. sp. triticale]VDB85961.1 Bgt-4293 [Blumeria graminis f. sp. tritici]